MASRCRTWHDFVGQRPSISGLLLSTGTPPGRSRCHQLRPGDGGVVFPEETHWPPWFGSDLNRPPPGPWPEDDQYLRCAAEMDHRLRGEKGFDVRASGGRGVAEGGNFTVEGGDGEWVPGQVVSLGPA